MTIFFPSFVFCFSSFLSAHAYVNLMRTKFETKIHSMKKKKKKNWKTLRKKQLYAHVWNFNWTSISYWLLYFCRFRFVFFFLTFLSIFYEIFFFRIENIKLALWGDNFKQYRAFQWALLFIENTQRHNNTAHDWHFTLIFAQLYVIIRIGRGSERDR